MARWQRLISGLLSSLYLPSNRFGAAELAIRGGNLLGLVDTSHVRLLIWAAIVGSDINSVWSGVIYQTPSMPISTHALAVHDLDGNQVEVSWCLYRQLGDDETPRPSHVFLAALEYAELYRIIHDGKNSKATADDTSTIYDRYLNWMQKLPPAISRIGGDDEVVPHVIFI